MFCMHLKTGDGEQYRGMLLWPFPNMANVGNRTDTEYLASFLIPLILPDTHTPLQHSVLYNPLQPLIHHLVLVAAQLPFCCSI